MQFPPKKIIRGIFVIQIQIEMIGDQISIPILDDDF